MQRMSVVSACHTGKYINSSETPSSEIKLLCMCIVDHSTLAPAVASGLWCSHGDCTNGRYTSSVCTRGGSGTCPTDRHRHCGTGDIAAGDLSTAMCGWRLDIVQR